jgi:hypothetical protein
MQTPSAGRVRETFRAIGEDSSIFALKYRCMQDVFRSAGPCTASGTLNPDSRPVIADPEDWRENSLFFGIEIPVTALFERLAGQEPIPGGESPGASPLSRVPPTSPCERMFYTDGLL